MRIKLLFILALLCAVVQGTWATETTYDNGIFTGFTATAGSLSNNYSPYSNLVDADVNSSAVMKTANPTYIEFYSSGYIVPTGYIITSGPNCDTNQELTPKRWAVKAKVNQSDTEWTTLASETDNPKWNINSHPYEFNISGNTTAYKYFRLEFYENHGDWYYLFSMFQFKGTTTDLYFSAISNVDPYYELPPSSSSSISPVVKDYKGTTLTLGTDFTATLNDVAVTEFPINISTLGSYTLTVTGTGSYVGSKSLSFNVYTTLSGEGTSNDPITISSADEWNAFANKVNNGTSYSGQFVKLTNNISVTKKVGVVSGSTQVNAFSGTFDGGSNTITANITDNDNQGTALFCYINGATIKNLNVAGTITSNKNYAAALVGFSKGTNTIENCKVSANVNGKGYVGGIVGHSTDSDISITGSVYSGLMTGGNNCTRVFIGWSENGSTKAVTNCLYAMADGQSTSSFDLVKDGGTLTMDRLYKTASVGSQGMLVYITLPANEVYKEVLIADMPVYVPCTISGIADAYNLDNGVSITPVLNDGERNLTLGSQGGDYSVKLDGTVTVYPINITTKGEHTITFKGENSYHGTKDVRVVVYSTLSGSGNSESDPVIIGCDGDWWGLVSNVNGGNSYSGKFVKLTADITVTEMVGTSSNKFQGTFLGDGIHTLTFNKGTAQSAFNEEYCAPFRYTDGATFKDLKVAGDIYINQKFGGGLIARSYGTTTITNCHVSTVIHSSKNGDGTHGGFIVIPEGDVNFSGCVYDGRMFTNNGTTHCGGFVGWHNSKTFNITNSLYAPNANITPATGEVAITTECATFVRGCNPNITNCYYTETMGTAQGTQVYAAVTEGGISKVINVYNTTVYSSSVCTVSGIAASYNRCDAGSISPVVKYDETTLVFGTDYTVTLNGAAVNEYPINNISTPGSYTLTFTGKGSYAGSKSVTFVVNAELSGEGTSNDPHIISSADDWNTFAANVNDGNSYSGKYVKLMDNFSVSEMVGTSDHKFKGTFLGNNKTLTLNLSATSNDCALFAYIDGATIQDLTITGTVSTSAKFGASIAAHNNGESNITNCHSSAIITGNGSGDGTHGGFVAMNEGGGKLSFTQCSFTGRMRGSATNCGGFVGWDSGTATNYSDCLFAPAELTMGASGSSTFNRNTSRDYTTAYYTTAFGTTQGRLVTLTVPENEIYKPLTVAGNNVYMPCPVSGVDTEYYSAASITPVVKGAGDTNLTLGTDFTATLNSTPVESFPISISTSGSYTLVLTGTGSFLGSKSFSLTALTPLSGTGTAGDPYLIKSNDDWLVFAANVNSGTESYSDKFVKLTANITVSKMVGTSDHKFQGTLLGDGVHTLTFNKGTAESAFNEQYCAPFRYTDGATFQNLKVAGDIYTSEKFGAGLIGHSYGTTAITGCHVSMVIHSSKNGDGTHSGFIAHPEGDVNFSDCVYDGRMFTNNGTTQCGGFIGWHNSKTFNITNSFYAPNPNIRPAANEVAITAECATFVRGGNPAESSTCYYTEAMSTVQGTLVSSTAPVGRIYKSITAANNKSYYISIIVSNVEDYYQYTGSAISIIPTVTEGTINSTELAAGTDYTYAISPATVQAVGNYTVTITGTGSYTGTETINIHVVNGNGSGNSAEDPIIINSADAWNTFASTVNGGNSYSGKFLALTKDISVTTMVGTVSGSTRDKFFSGTFDGNGHTITVSYNDQENEGVAPFRYIKDATIKNLNVAGSTMSDKNYASGLVGFAEGTNLIKDCIVTVELRHDDHCDIIGGIIGHGLTSTTTLDGCVFAGRFVGQTLYHAIAGALWGWGDEGTPILIDCMEMGSYEKVNAYHPIGNQGNAGTITNCYYLNSVFDRGHGANYGKFCTVKGAYQVQSTLPGNKLCKVINYKNSVYYVPYTTYSRNHYPYTGSDIDIYLEMVDAEGKPCVKGTDCTCTFYPETVKEVGNYTLTITGNAPNFTGTIVIPITVTDCLLNSLFTVNASGEKVQFSQGNLQATTIDKGTTWTWDFATSQLDYIGDTQTNKDCTTNGTVDLFGWVGASSPFTGVAQYGVRGSTNNSGHGSVANEVLKSDWGNTIAPGYRTLTADEWDYLFNTRETGTTVNAFNNARYTYAQVNGVKGVILFPEGANFDYLEANAWGTINAPSEWGTHCSTSQWEALAAKGCVFLPAAGNRFYKLHEWTYNHNMFFEWRITIGSDQGHYWTSSPSTGATTAYALYMAPDDLNPRNSTDRYFGRSVRLVKDYEITTCTLEGTGTLESPYLIKTTEDWDEFVSNVKYGYTFSGEFVKLDANIIVSTMVGTSYANSFQGTFDGGGHTLTVNYNSSENNAAPFSHVSNATIKNLHVAGTITTSAPFAGGIVSESHGALTLTGCISSVAINSSKSGDGTHAGLVSVLSGRGNAILIDGCVFDGSFATTTGTYGCGGFIGWGVYNKPVIRNSLLKPSSVGANMLGSNFARWHTGDGGIYEPTFTDCYYVATDNLPTDQGTQVYAFAKTPTDLGALVKDYGMVKAYENAIIYDGKYYAVPASISLADNADNTTTISNVDGYVADVTLADRTLYKDGKWNTICLPFKVVLEGSALEGAVARPLTAASISGTTLNLTFGDAVTTLTAGTPYIIKWESGNNIVSPVFYGVTIDKTDRCYDNCVSGDQRVRFLGTYKSTAFDATDNSFLLMGGNNTLYYPTTGAGIGAQRAYFKIGDGTALARLTTNFNIDFGDGETTTGIISIENGQLTIDNSAGGWYSLDGRRLDSKPTKKGVYINNGKKTVIK